MLKGQQLTVYVALALTIFLLIQLATFKFYYLLPLVILVLLIIHRKKIVTQNEQLQATLFEREAELLKTKDKLEAALQEKHNKLQECSEKYKTLFDNFNDAIYVYALNADNQPGPILEVNETAVARMGYSREEFLKMSLVDFNTSSLNEILDHSMKELLRNKFLRLDVVHVTKTGQEIPIEINATLFEMNGQSMVISVARDIAERKAAELEIKDSHAKYKAIIENFDGYVYICSADYTIEFMNQNLIKRTGYDGTGQPCHKVLHNLDFKCPWCVNDKVFQGETIKWEMQSPKDNKWYFITNNPLYNADGSISKHAIIFDITNRKRYEETLTDVNQELEKRVKLRTNQLENALQELEAFSYSVSHDLQAPLRSMHGFSRILMEDYLQALDQEGQTYLKKISDASLRMANLIDALLNLSRISRHQPQCRDIDLSRLVETIINDIKDREKEDLTCYKIMPGMKIKGDADLMKIVWENLIGNAWKFSRKTKDPLIEVGMLEKDNDTVFFVKDNGAGFNMAFSKKLFGAFQRLHRETEFSGTGIGLATVHRIINRHHGRIWAESEPGNGATFYFTVGNP